MKKISSNKREDFERILRQAQFEKKFQQTKNIESLNEDILPNKKEQMYLNKNTIKNAIKRDQLNLNKRKNLEDSYGNNSVKQAIDFLSFNKNWYLNFGGAGDLILLIANAYKDDKAQIVFFANGSSYEFCKELLDFFKIENYIAKNLMGTKHANVINDYMTQKINFKPSAHLSRGLDFNDWGRDLEYYKKRMIFKTDWVERFGKSQIFMNDKMIILQPSGSTRNYDRQRYLEIFEYNYLVKKFLDLGYVVVSTGSENDKDHYRWKPTSKNDWFMTSKKLYNQRSITPIDMNSFIKIINTANKLISADTWIKSYSLLCNIPTYVFSNRCRGKYLPIGADPCDYIFINKDIWTNLNIMTIDDIIKMT